MTEKTFSQNLKPLNIKRAISVSTPKSQFGKFTNQKHEDHAGDSLGNYGIITSYLIEC